ncbi:MAG: 2-phosphosulfolactate phosphatase [Trueperaceae bacterium]
MRVRIDLLPRPVYHGELVVLIDILRSCTVAPVLFDGGLSRLTMCASLREARKDAAGGKLLVGERAGVPPEGFNYGNSPSELRRADLAGREAVVVSDNAPKALPALEGASEVLLASLYNAAAVASAVRSAARERVSLVCSGYHGQEDLDDTMAAGFLAGEISRLTGGVRFEGAARLAIGLLRAFPDPLEALWHSTAGRTLRSHELAEDLAVASMISQSDHVPRLVAIDAGRHSDLYRFESLSAAG